MNQPPLPRAPLAAPARPAPEPDRGRRAAGLVLWILGMLAGTALTLFFFGTVVANAKKPLDFAASLAIGALCAFPPLFVYLFVPALIDRFDPEPWWCLLMAFLWGALVATGFSGIINSLVGHVAGNLFGVKTGTLVAMVISAPITEEFWKGLAVFGFFFFLRREFDGVVDGIIYATFCALGFAAVENMLYYARADQQHALGQLFVLRGVLAPWGHPLYTSMTGIGFGLARESSSTAVRIFAPLAGYAAAVTLHFIWNLSASVLHVGGFLLSLVLWFCFVLAFFILIVVLVFRKGKTIRENLRDEVLIGNLTQEELDLICSPVGRLRCTFSWRGATGRRFIRSAARLALSKWHTARAMKGQKRTISADFIVPLRQELAALRAELWARAPKRAPAR